MNFGFEAILPTPLGNSSPETLTLKDPAGNLVDQVVAGKFNSFRSIPHLAARLRRKISAAESALAVQALLRRNQFDDEARYEVFQSLADHFMARVPFPSEVTDGLSHEQIVRNVVDSLYRTAG